MGGPGRRREGRKREGVGEGKATRQAYCGGNIQIWLCKCIGIPVRFGPSRVSLTTYAPPVTGDLFICLFIFHPPAD